MNKHKKLTVNRLALGNLKTRKKQYTLMIVGILLAMIFSSGVLFFISCTQSSTKEIQRRTTGNSYGIFYDCEDAIDPTGDFEKDYIAEYGYGHIVGYGYTDEEKQNRGTTLAWLEEDAKPFYYAYFKEGRWPEAEGEIAVEADALLRLGLDAQVGDKITLSVLTPDGDKFMDGAEEKTYTLVGILGDKRSNIEYEMVGTQKNVLTNLPAAFVYSGEEVKPGGKEIKLMYYNATEESLKDNIKEYVGEYSHYTSAFMKYFYEKYQDYYDNHIFGFSGLGAYYNSLAQVESGTVLATVLAGVLMAASCIGIINAFTTNLQERKKQIGLLRAVGTTSRQIINIFGREAFIISLICAPISVLISYFGVKLFAYLMGDSFVFLPNVWVLLGTTAVSVVCVMLSALLPLARAARTSPMQAIRNVELSRKMKRKKIRQEKNFAAPKLLARRSIAFYRARQVLVSVILTATVFLSCFGFALVKAESQNYSYFSVDYLVRQYTYYNISPYVNTPNIDWGGITENEKQEIFSYPLFKSVYGVKEYNAFLNVEEYTPYLDMMVLCGHNSSVRYESKLTDITEDTQMTAENFKDIWFEGESKIYQRIKNKVGFEQEFINIGLQGYDAALMEKFLDRFEVTDGEINIDKLNSGEEIILVAPQEAFLQYDIQNNGYSYCLQDASKPIEIRHEYKSHTVQLDYKAGDTIKLSTLYSQKADNEGEDEEVMLPADTVKYDKEVKIGAIVKRFDFAEYFYGHNFSIITTVEGLQHLTKEDLPYSYLAIEIKGENDDDKDEAATNFLNGYVSGTGYEARSDYYYSQQAKEDIKMFFVGMLSVIILFFSISASIINNALTAKIRESKREIGTLRAVGASVKEITASYIRQLLSMFGWGCAAGFGGYTAVHFIAKLILKDEYDFTYEIWQAAAIVALLFVVCSINLYAKIKKEMKNSIVENIREL